MKTMIVSLMLLASSSAFAGHVNMTCEQALATYEKYGRIYVYANGDDLVPIYGLTPNSKLGSLRCRGRGKSRAAYWIQTTDENSCVIGWRCQ